VSEVGVVSVAADAWVFGDLRLSAVPETHPFRVPCMTPEAYGWVLYRPYRTTLAADVLRRALAHLATRESPRPALGAVVDQHLPRGCSGHLKEAVEGLAWRHPVVASTQGIIDGVHRLTAMRHQGVKTTPALVPARPGQRLDEIPGAYPHQPRS
jgi:hypothetical protein